MAALRELNRQSDNVKILTADFLKAQIDTVLVEPYSFAYVSDGEWLEKGSDGKFIIPGAGAIPAATSLAGKNMYLVTGKPTEPSRQAMSKEIVDYTVDSNGGYLPIYNGHLPVEIDSMIYDTGATWTAFGAPVYVVSVIIATNARTVLSTSATGDGGLAGLLVGSLVRPPASNGGMVRVRLHN